MALVALMFVENPVACVTKQYDSAEQRSEAMLQVVCLPTGHGGAVTVSSANGLVGTGFASRYRPPHRACF